MIKSDLKMKKGKKERVGVECKVASFTSGTSVTL
jgi:hypothetical protein